MKIEIGPQELEYLKYFRLIMKSHIREYTFRKSESYKQRHKDIISFAENSIKWLDKVI